MSGDPKDEGSGTPQGLFSSGGTPKKTEDEPQEEPASFDIAMPAGRTEDPHDSPTREVERPLFSFPPPEAQGTEEVVLEDIDQNRTERTSSSFPPPLGQAEGHDAWTVDRMNRQSTVPPVHKEDVDRLRELSHRTSLRPEDVSGEGGALDLVDRSRPSAQLDLVGEMEELYALDDLTGALRFAELILGREPDNPQALRCAEKSRERLIGLYVSKIGDLNAVPVAAVNDSEMRWLGLDHRAGFLLSRVDSMSTVDEILDICGMPRLEALKTLVDLLERGAIRV